MHMHINTAMKLSHYWSSTPRYSFDKHLLWQIFDSLSHRRHSAGFPGIEIQSCQISRPAAHERRHFRSRLGRVIVSWRNEKEHQRLRVQRELQGLSDGIALRLWTGLSFSLQTHESTHTVTCTETHWWQRISVWAKPSPLLQQIMNTSTWSWIRSCPSTAPKSGREKPARWDIYLLDRWLSFKRSRTVNRRQNGCFKTKRGLEKWSCDTN